MYSTVISRMLMFIVPAIIFFGCGNKGGRLDKEKIDLDQNVTNRHRPLDTVFLNFEKDWKKFISPNQMLAMPVMVTEEKQSWEPLIFSDCSFQAEVQANVPQVELTWNEPAMQEQPLRFDIALHYQGFEKNYYTSVLATDKPERFALPANSAFINDTAAVLLTGPSIFPKVQGLNRQTLASPNIDQQQQNVTLRSTLKLTQLGPGLSYRIRMSRFNKEVWIPTQEVIITTPICPTDYK